jgi:hypothetical protein
MSTPRQTFERETEQAEIIMGQTAPKSTGRAGSGDLSTESVDKPKARLGHGKFLDWIEKEFGWAERSARRFMEVFAHVKTAKLADIQIDVSALYLIAAPNSNERKK